MFRSEFTEYSKAISTTTPATLPSDQYVTTGDAFSVFSVVYEKVRTSVERSDDHRLLQLVVARIYQRLFVPGQDPAMIGRTMVEELIRSGYITNGSLPLSQLESLQQMINTHALWLSQQLPGIPKQDTQRLFDWTVQVVARLLAYSLDDTNKTVLFAQAMQQVVQPALIRKSGLPDITAEQTTLAILRAHYGLDEPGLAAMYLWIHSGDVITYPEQLLNYNLVELYQTITTYDTIAVHADLRKTMVRLRSLYIVAEQIVSDQQLVMQELNASQIEELVDVAIQKVFITTKQRVWRVLARGALAILVVKVLYAITIDIPVDVWLLGGIQWLPVIVNILFHPALLVAMGVVLRTPRPASQRQLSQLVQAVLFATGPFQIPLLTASTTISPRRQRVFMGLYVFVAAALLAIALVVLAQFNFTSIGAITFSVFLAITLHIGAKQRQKLLVLYAFEYKQSLFSVLIDIVTIPLMSIGKSLAELYSRFNVIVIVLDLFIEAPFKLIVDALEQWRAQLREEREKLGL